MICDCKEHVRQRREDRRKHVPCWRNGRRLRDAWDFVSKKANERLVRSRTISLADCEGDHELRDIVSLLLKRLHALEMQRFGYLDKPPWTAVHCHSPEGSKNVLDQVAKHPLSEHDPLTVRIVQELGPHIQARAAGGDVHPHLAEMLARMDTVNLDESCGEGWHRGSAYEKKRAYAATPAHLKRAVRRQGVYRRIRKFRRTHGKAGDAVVRFEFRKWKRILAKRASKWVPRRMSDEVAFGEIYRENASSEVNWSTVVSRMGLHHIETEASDNTGGAQNEYLRAQVQTGGHYSVHDPS